MYTSEMLLSLVLVGKAKTTEVAARTKATARRNEEENVLRAIVLFESPRARLSFVWCRVFQIECLRIYLAFLSKSEYRL